MIASIWWLVAYRSKCHVPRPRYYISNNDTYCLTATKWSDLWHKFNDFDLFNNTTMNMSFRRNHVGQWKTRQQLFLDHWFKKATDKQTLGMNKFTPMGPWKWWCIRYIHVNNETKSLSTNHKQGQMAKKYWAMCLVKIEKYCTWQTVFVPRCCAISLLCTFILEPLLLLHTPQIHLDIHTPVYLFHVAPLYVMYCNVIPKWNI